MIDDATAEADTTMEDTGVHRRRRSALIAHAAKLLERAERLGSDRPPPATSEPPSEPPTFHPVDPVSMH